MRWLFGRCAGLPPGARWGCVVFSVALITWLSSQPGGTTPSPLWLSVLFNAGHFVLFGGLAFWLACALGASSDGKARGAFVLAVAFGVVDELHQGFVPHRDSSMWDLVTDAGGALAAVAWVHAVARGVAWSRVSTAAAVAAGVVGVAGGSL